MLASRQLLLFVATAAVGTAAPAQRPALRDSILVLMPTAEIFSAISHADTAALRPLLGDDLRWVVGNSGAVFEKPQLLTAAAHSSPLVSLDYTIDSVHTWQHGDVATAEYRLTDRRTFREYQNVFVYRASDVYVLRSGHWELVRTRRSGSFMSR